MLQRRMPMDLGFGTVLAIGVVSWDIAGVPHMKKLCGKNQDAGCTTLGNKRNVIAMSGLRSITGTSQTRRWVGIIVVMAALLLGSAGVGDAWGFGHGFGGHGFHHFGHFHRFGARIGIGIGPFWGPYWAPYVYPPAVVQSPPPVVVQPPLHRHLGTIATIRGATTHMSNNAREAGGQWPPRHRSRPR